MKGQFSAGTNCLNVNLMTRSVLKQLAVISFTKVQTHPNNIKYHFNTLIE